MDLSLNYNQKTIDLNLEHKPKVEKQPKKAFLCENIYKEFYSSQESDEDFQKTFDFESDVKHKKTKKLSKRSFEKSVKDIDSTYKTNILDQLLVLLTNKLKISVDFIHERYLLYANQTQSQRDSSKTDYTYVRSFSYTKSVEPSALLDWVVPNMSRKSITMSSKTTQSTSSSSTISRVEMSENSSITESVMTNNRQLTPDSRGRALIFTRSQCAGGAQCEAGCEVHKKVRKRTQKSAGILIPNSGQGLEPEIEFSEDDESYSMNNRLNYEILNNNRQNGNNLLNDNLYDSEDEEEITVVRRVNKIFRTTINNTSKLIDSMTPTTVKNWPKVWLLLPLLLFLGPLVYALSHYMSSPSTVGSLDALTSDMSSKYAINQLVSELKAIKYDLQTLKLSNNELKQNLKSNENNENEKYFQLNNKIEKIEDFFENVMKNCCRNETDSLLALIDLRLSSFMSSMLTNDQSIRQSLTPSEAAQELKAFIHSEIRKTNEVFRGSVEQKLMETIERVENRVKRERSEELSANITVDEVKSLISQALAIYDADKTGQPDYALEPAGGTVINTRCSETFDPHGVQYKIFGIPFWSSSVSPRAVIQPSISPGECWAFKGSTGHLVIKLSQTITPSAFSYEHIPKQISRDGNIDSAPKEMQVRGLEDENDVNGHLLGNYVYEDNDIPMQLFEVQDPNPRPVQYIELIILSNHGHNDYTCLYRFRVHGKRVQY